MDCERVREALSARIDGEEPGLPTGVVDLHLADCGECRAWHAGALRVTDLTAPMATVPAPDLTARVLAAVAADRRAAEARRSRRTVLRLAVAVAAGAQLVLALPALLGADLHVTKEMAACQVALAAGFALAAWWPRFAAGYLPVALVLAAALALASVVDIAHGRATVWHETAHLAVLVQAGLLWGLARVVGDGRAAIGRRRDAVAA